MRLRPLSLIEARVLATLMEKARTVPDSYPLTLNSLVLGCNQKTAREPLTSLTDAQAQEALDALRLLSLVFESSGGRVTRWEHNFQRAVGVPDQSAALLGLLMLRGPQTAGELRINTERWHKFADISSVEAFLEELQDRSEEKGGPLVVKLARAAGAREQRWAHLLCGPVDAAALAQADAGAHTMGLGAGLGASAGTGGPAASDERALAARIAALEATVEQLRSAVRNIHDALGMSQPGQVE